MDRHEYMTTGEFASAMGVSKDTLFHYDDIGLFCPEKVSENGYRYYSIYQMETFDTIRMLRDLGMPLKEIRDMLAHRSPERVMHVFAEREQQIDREIEKLKAMKQWLSRRREKIADEEKTDFPWVKSYGKNAKDDLLRLRTGSGVFIEGFLQTRAVERKCRCSTCGSMYTWNDYAMEIVSYETEYLKDYVTDEELSIMKNSLN